MHIHAIITGKSDWGTFGYHSCPSISVDFAGHKDRIANGNPTLPFFNTYNADLSNQLNSVVHPVIAAAAEIARQYTVGFLSAWIVISARK